MLLPDFKKFVADGKQMGRIARFRKNYAGLQGKQGKNFVQRQSRNYLNHALSALIDFKVNRLEQSVRRSLVLARRLRDVRDPVIAPRTCGCGSVESMEDFL